MIIKQTENKVIYLGTFNFAAARPESGYVIASYYSYFSMLFWWVRHSFFFCQFVRTPNDMTTETKFRGCPAKSKERMGRK